jgi:diacylglycerol kinase family enzyme
VNRRAGGRPAAIEILDRVERVASDIAFTEYAGHAAELARRVAEGNGGVIVVGGDGTLLEVLNAHEGRRPKVALIATGRGNSLARDLGVYPAARGCAALECGESRPIDLMEIRFRTSSGNTRTLLSASTIAAGYPAAVVRSAGKGFARFGKYSYAVAAALLRPPRVGMRIRGEGMCVLTGIVANNTRHMANFVGAPAASCGDGEFDILRLRAGYFGQAAHNLSAISRLGFYQPVKPEKARALSVELQRPERLMIDGELFEDVIAFEVRVLPGAVSIQVGQSA